LCVHCTDKIAHRVASGMMEPEATAACLARSYSRRYGEAIAGG